MSSHSSPSERSYTTQTRYSSSSTNRTISRNGGQPETTTETASSSSSSSNGDSIPLFPDHQFPDNFEELKRSILNGDAYKRSQKVHQESPTRRGQQHYKPDEGVTTIRPTRPQTEREIPVQPVRAQRVASASKPSSHTPYKPAMSKDINGNDSGICNSIICYIQLLVLSNLTFLTFSKETL